VLSFDSFQHLPQPALQRGGKLYIVTGRKKVLPLKGGFRRDVRRKTLILAYGQQNNTISA
jgi:hypothetical protein